jgi:molybdate transport system substrate-binding protein
MPRLAALLLLLLLPAAAFAADQLSIAAAANLSFVLGDLDAQFQRAQPDTHVTVAFGASGSLVAQIENGAPFDLFLSADMDFPAALIARGGAEKESLTKFAVGRLVLWTTRPQVEVASLAGVVHSPAVLKLAIANVKSAPYGRAAQQALMKLGLWADAQPKLVVGESISQTAQFVETGNADAGFVAMSLVLAPKLKDRGKWIEVPADLYAPLDQGAVITHRGRDNAAAKRYLDFLLSPAAQEILARFGYRSP